MKNKKYPMDLTGERFGRLTTITEDIENKKDNDSYWFCICDCGKEKMVKRSNLISGHTKSCGCSRSNKAKEKNEYRVDGKYAYIKLKSKSGIELETVIDARNLNKVLELDLSWHLKWANSTQSYYCKATKYLGKINNKYSYETVHLHNIIVPLSKENHVIHHKNHDTLDNREENLEEISNRKNVIDRRGANPNNYSTGYRNVSLIKDKYVVQMIIDGKRRTWKFDNLEDAINCAEYNRYKHYSKVK